MTNDCPLCNPVDERVIWRGKLVRVIDASDDDLPGFVRVIVKRHAAEMVDLTPEESAMVRKAVPCANCACSRPCIRTRLIWPVSAIWCRTYTGT